MTRNLKARSATENPPAGHASRCASLSVPPTRLGTCVCVCWYIAFVTGFRRGAPRYELLSTDHSVIVRCLV